MAILRRYLGDRSSHSLTVILSRAKNPGSHNAREALRASALVVGVACSYERKISRS